MNKTYLKQFFTLTEQNILGHQASANHNFEEIIKHKEEKSSKFKLNFMQRFHVIFIVAIVGFVVPLWIKLYPTTTLHAKATSPQMASSTPLKKKTPHLQPLQQLTSSIPFYRDGAKRQYLQPISLRRADIAFYQEQTDTTYAAIKPNVDKVIVVPKSFG